MTQGGVTITHQRKKQPRSVTSRVVYDEDIYSWWLDAHTAGAAAGLLRSEPNHAVLPSTKV